MYHALFLSTLLQFPLPSAIRDIFFFRKNTDAEQFCAKLYLRRKVSDLRHRCKMIQLTVQLRQMIQDWIRREIIDFDPYEEAQYNQLQLCPEPIRSV
jgi:hypothetical protein